MKEEKKFKKAVIIILLMMAAVFGYLVLLNGRYIASNHRENHLVFDQWKGEYVRPQTHKR